MADYTLKCEPGRFEGLKITKPNDAVLSKAIDAGIVDWEGDSQCKCTCGDEGELVAAILQRIKKLGGSSEARRNG